MIRIYAIPQEGGLHSTFKLLSTDNSFQLDFQKKAIWKTSRWMKKRIMRGTGLESIFIETLQIQIFSDIFTHSSVYFENLCVDAILHIAFMPLMMFFLYGKTTRKNGTNADKIKGKKYSRE